MRVSTAFAGLVLLMLSLWLLRAGRPEAGGPDRPVVDTTPQDSRADPTEPARTPSARQVAGNLREGAVPSFGRGSLLVHAVDATTGLPAVGVPLVLEHSRPGEFPPAVTDDDGQAEFAALPPGRVAVFSSGSHVAIDVEEEVEVEAWLTVGRRPLEVFVVDERGEGVANALVFLSRRPRERLGFLVGRTDGLGYFVLDDYEPGRWIAAYAEGKERSDCHTAEGADFIPPLRIVLRDGGRTFRGRVVDGDGEGIADAVVAVGGRNWPRLEPFGALPVLGHFPARSRTDPGGGFSLDGLPDQSLDVRVTAPGFVPWIGRTTPGEQPTLVRMERGARVAGVVQDRSGSPVSGAHVSWADQPEVFSVSLPDGRFELDAPGIGDHTLEARTLDFRMGVSSVLVPTDGAVFVRVEIDPSFSVEGRLTDAAGDPASRWILGWTEPFAARPRSLALTDDEGRFRFWRDKIEPPQDLVAAPKDLDVSFPLEVGTWNGEEALELAAAFVTEGLGAVSLQVDDPVRWAVKLRRSEDGAVAAGTVTSEGSCRFAGLTPGDYTVLFLDPRAAHELPRFRVEPGADLDLGTWSAEDVRSLAPASPPGHVRQEGGR